MAAPVHAYGDDALGELDATGVAEAIASGDIGAEDAVEAAIARAERVASLDAFAHRGFAEARERAHRPAGGVFSGVPTVVKDNIDVAGQPSGHGSSAFTPAPAAADGAFTQQFLATGAVSLGKSRLPEFGFNATTEFADAPPTRNPWNPDYSSGASSGGSAALVAAGVVPFAHANDGGGSIRIPAAACGLVGLKPTRGRLLAERADTLVPVRLVTQGVVTRTVRDTARFLHAAETYRRAPSLPPIRLVTGPAATRLRIGVVTDSLTARPDPETRAAVEETAHLLEGLGHHVEPASLPVGQDFVEAFEIYWGMLAFLASTTGKSLGRDFDRTRTDPLTRGLYSLYRKNIRRTPSIVYRLRRSARSYARMFESFDVVLSPVVAATTPELGYLAPSEDFDTMFARLIGHVAYTPLNNAAGGPAMSLPLHTTAAGLPLGMHFSAAHGDERTLLELAFELEQARPFPMLGRSSSA
ncbi:amidase [Rhodococcus rhodnii]|uniref:amidase n=2 Tax=Rhodococcus rhodnii TaxID=38312 RepID=R7WQH5_9NOCA|nr:amidase [Rhodococcus rhodnii]EOM76234.1 amidase [Rhodococcus rhodnii LMG 5362]TXG90789.1 amidase [Rhodococcus rhodnii]